MKELIISLTFFSISFSSCAQETKIYNKENVNAVLDSIRNFDRQTYSIAKEIYRKFGTQSEEAFRQNKANKVLRSINLEKVEKIIEECQWPESDIIGKEGSNTIWVVIQHSDSKTQIKYLPKIKEATQKGIIKPAQVAYMEDRIATYQGKKQIYGSQIKFDPKTESSFVWPIENPENVDQRRATVGLGPLAPHIKKKFGLTWDIKKHKKRPIPAN